MMRINSEAILTPGLRSVLNALGAGGATARLVGGCVRDALLGRPVGDRDVAVDAPPQEAVRLLAREGIRVKPIGIEFGSILALPNEGGGYEVTSLRRDIESDGRRPVVGFGTDWTEDARRRDFTMNALYADAEGVVYDPIGGIGDLRAGRVRFIAVQLSGCGRITCEFSGSSGFTPGMTQGPMDPAGLEACTSAARCLERLSGERVGSEMRKLLAAPDPSAAVAEAQKACVLAQVLSCSGPAALGPLIALERKLGIPPNWMRRWLLLVAGAAGDPLGHWPLSRKEERALRARLEAWSARPGPMEAGRRWARRLPVTPCWSV